MIFAHQVGELFILTITKRNTTERDFQKISWFAKQKHIRARLCNSHIFDFIVSLEVNGILVTHCFSSCAMLSLLLVSCEGAGCILQQVASTIVPGAHVRLWDPRGNLKAQSPQTRTPTAFGSDVGTKCKRHLVRRELQQRLFQGVSV